MSTAAGPPGTRRGRRFGFLLLIRAPRHKPGCAAGSAGRCPRLQLMEGRPHGLAASQTDRPWAGLFPGTWCCPPSPPSPPAPQPPPLALLPATVPRLHGHSPNVRDVPETSGPPSLVQTHWAVTPGAGRSCSLRGTCARAAGSARPRGQRCAHLAASARRELGLALAGTRQPPQTGDTCCGLATPPLLPGHPCSCCRVRESPAPAPPPVTQARPSVSRAVASGAEVARF